MIELVTRPKIGDAGAFADVADAAGDETRIDLHVHSHASGFATNWWVRGLGLGIETRESYTTPDEVWSRARIAGMDFVTLTDHDSLAGAQELWHRPRFLTGVEVNALFPEDGSSVDLLIHGLSEEDHREIQTRRANAYALVDFLREARLVHVLAHPLFDLGARLGKAQVEKRMVLFAAWEMINGARPEAQGRLAARIATLANGSTLRTLARLHGLPAPDHDHIVGTGGSDDHGGKSGAADAMAHTAFAIAAQAIIERPDAVAVPEPFTTLREFLPLVPALSSDQIRQLAAARYEARLTQSFSTGEGGFQPVQLLASIGRLVEGHLVVAPYVAIHGYFGRERHKSQVLAQEFGLRDGPLRVGVVVDDLDEIHGVATMYRNLERAAQLVIVGDGPYRGDLKAELGEDATFTGFLQGEDLARTIASCDFLVFPSTTETLGRAIIEAQACGLPAVVRDAGGAAECLASGVSGIVVPADESQGYWSAVETLLDDPKLRRNMSEAARQFAVQRTWEQVLEGFVALCESVSNQSGVAVNLPVGDAVGVAV